MFCGYFAGTGDAALSAKKAGFKGDCQLHGDRLLCDEAVIAEIDRQLTLRRRTISRTAAIGYQRLAFGSVADALRLALTENPDPDILDGMDLYMVSDVKRNRDGSLEIKFFDRLKALEKLGGDAREDAAGVTGLMEAIGRGAMAAGGSNDD